jgi:cellulose synthase/poly-beta-1,6-N-acetylglucosamine synthase-like glycosyltransferase
MQQLRSSFKNCKRYVCITEDANSPSKGRNIGARLAAGHILAFTDADCVASPDWLEKLALEISGRKGLAGGPNRLSHRSNSALTNAIDGVFATYLGSGGSPQFWAIKKVSEVHALPACNMAVLRGVFDELGGFNEDLKYNEDTDFCRRAIKKGYKIVYSPTAVIEHFIGLDSYQQTTRFVRKYGLERGRNIRKNPYLFQKFNVLSTFFLFSVAFLFATAFVSPISQLVLSAVVASLTGVILAYSGRIAMRNRSLASFGYAVLIFFTIHVNYNLGLFSGLLLGEQKKSIKLLQKNSAAA